MNLADILTLAGLSQQEPTNSLSTPGSSCNQHMNPDDMRTLVIKLEQPQPEQEMVATEEAEGSYANAPDEQEVGDTHDDFSFKGFGKRKRHTHDALGNYGDNPLDESQLIAEYKNFKETDAYNDPDAWKDRWLPKGVHRKTPAPTLPDKVKEPQVPGPIVHPDLGKGKTSRRVGRTVMTSR